MKRPAGVTVSAALLILGAVLCVAIGGVMAVTFHQDPPPELRGTSIPRIYLALLVGGFFLALAVWATLTAAGLLLLKPWSRTSTLIYAGVLVFFQSGGLLLVLFTILAQPGFDARREAGLLAGLVLFYGVQILTGIAWLIYFRRPSVKGAFLASEPAAANPCPLSITVIAWHLVAFGGISVLMAIPSWPNWLLGLELRGWAARILYLFWGVAGLKAGSGLLRRQAAALNQSLAYVYAASLNTLACFPALLQNTRESFPQAGNPAAFPTGSSPWIWAAAAVVLLTCATPLWYLHTRKAPYLAAAGATPPK